MTPRDKAIVRRMAEAIARTRNKLMGWAEQRPTETDLAYARAAYDAEHRIKR